MKQKSIFLIIAFSLLLWNCSSPTATQETASPVTAQEVPTQAAVETLEPISVRLGMQTFGSNLPLYIGVEEGYFTEAGLDVTVVPFATDDVLVALLAGEIDVAGSLYSVAQFRERLAAYA